MERDVPNHVFNKDRIVIGLHRHMTLVGTLQKGIHRGGGRTLSDLYNLLYPDDLRLSPIAGPAPDPYINLTSLIVGAVIAYCSATWAEACNRDLDSQNEITRASVDLTSERALVVHETARAGH